MLSTVIYVKEQQMFRSVIFCGKQ